MNWYKDNSLLGLVKTRLKKDYHNLYETSYQEFRNILPELILGKDNWWIILLIVLAYFTIVPLINIDYFNSIEFKDGTPITLIDQRTTNIVTIISSSLAVIGFLIGNLAVKESNSYKILFKHTYLHPILFYVLSLTACFIGLSTLKDTINSQHFARLLVAGTYLIIIALFLIGLLFTRLFYFTNDKFILKRQSEELKLEAEKKTKKDVINKLSREELITNMNSLGIKHYSSFESYEAYEKISLNDLLPKKKQYKSSHVLIIKNIYLYKLKELIESEQDKFEYIRFSEFGIGTKMNSDTILFWIKFKDDAQDLRSQVISKLKGYLSINLSEISEGFTERKHIDDKFDEYVKDGKTKHIKDILDMYHQLYVTELDNRVKTN